MNDDKPQVTAGEEPAMEYPVNCHVCGTEVLSAVEYCPECGVKILPVGRSGKTYDSAAVVRFCAKIARITGETCHTDAERISHLKAFLADAEEYCKREGVELPNPAPAA